MTAEQWAALANDLGLAFAVLMALVVLWTVATLVFKFFRLDARTRKQGGGPAGNPPSHLK